MTGVLPVASIVMLKLHPLVVKENCLYSLHNMQLQGFLSLGVILVS